MAGPDRFNFAFKKKPGDGFDLLRALHPFAVKQMEPAGEHSDRPAGKVLLDHFDHIADAVMSTAGDDDKAVSLVNDEEELVGKVVGDGGAVTAAKKLSAVGLWTRVLCSPSACRNKVDIIMYFNRLIYFCESLVQGQ